MANLREAYDYAKNNPDSDFAKELESALSSGVLDTEAEKYGIDTSVFKPKPVVQQPVQEEQGIVQDIAQGITKPFLGVASQARDIGRTLQGEQLQGQQEYDYGYLGKVKSFGNANEDPMALVRGAGAGAGMASNIGMGGTLKTTGTSILARQLPKFFSLTKQGAGAGAMAMGGAAAQDGADAGTIANEATMGAVGGAIAAPVLGTAFGAAAKPAMRAFDVVSKPLQTYKSDVLNNINKALSIQGKKSIGQAVNVAPEKRFSAFETLYDLAPEIKVRDEFGQEVPFSPTEANFQQFGEALYKAKNNIWAKVDASLKQATEKGIEVDVTPALDDINRLITDVGVPNDVKAQAQSLSDEIAGFVTEKGTAPIEALARFNTYLNKKITGQITGTSNNATREVEAITAKNLSQAVDDAIENLAGKEFAQLKDSYSSLKAIENDTVRRMQQELRMLDTGLADFMNQYGTADMIGGVVALSQGNAAPLLRGVGTKVAANYMKSLRQPSKYLQDAFKQIDKFKKGEGIIPAVQELKKNSNFVKTKEVLPTKKNTESPEDIHWQKYLKDKSIDEKINKRAEISKVKKGFFNEYGIRVVKPWFKDEMTLQKASDFDLLDKKSQIALDRWLSSIPNENSSNNLVQNKKEMEALYDAMYESGIEKYNALVKFQEGGAKNKFSDGLPEVLGKKAPGANGRNLAPNSYAQKFQKQGDYFIEELGFKDRDEAQDFLESFKEVIAQRKLWKSKK